MIGGQKFSQVYIEKGVALPDSARMRNRLSAVSFDYTGNHSFKLAKLIMRETGAKMPYFAQSYSFAKFFETCELRDLLDSITLIFKWHGGSPIAKKWKLFVERVFKEENVGYRLDDKCGVHYFVDEEFEHSRAITVANLSSQPAVLEAFEKAHSFLDQDPPDTASAIRAMFEALEILYKHIVDAEGKERLNGFGVNKNLKPLLQKAFTENLTAATAVDHMMDGLCDWIDAGHMYRHGQKVKESSPPPLSYAVMFISQGAGFLRFLLPLAKR